MTDPDDEAIDAFQEDERRRRTEPEVPDPMIVEPARADEIPEPEPDPLASDPNEVTELEAAANDYLQTSGLCRKASERDANEGNTSGALANLTISHFAQLTSTLLSSTILVVRRLERIEAKLDALRIEVDAIGDGVEAVEVRTR